MVEVRGYKTISVNGELFPSTTDFTELGSVPTRNKLTRAFILKNTGNSTSVFPLTNIVVSSNATQYNIF